MKPKVILLVEDNPDDVELALRALKKHNTGHETIVARDGADALDYLMRQGKHKDRDPSIVPDLVLLDLKLPKVNGLEVLRHFRENNKDKSLPVIVILTSSKEYMDIVKSYQYGANSYIRKPVDYDDFIQAIHDLGTYWLLINETPEKEL